MSKIIYSIKAYDFMGEKIKVVKKNGANIIASAKIMSSAFVLEQTKCAKFRWTLIGISVPKVTKWRQIERYIILVKCGFLKENT